MKETSIEAVRRHVERMRRSNLRQGKDSGTGLDYAYLCPSPGRYRWQWFWDSCFHAVVMAHVDPEMAMAELRTLVAGQDHDGFIGHISFWGSHRVGDLWGRLQSPLTWRFQHSALIQPPVLAQAVARVAEVTHEPTLTIELLPALDRYHAWLADHRVPDRDGLLVIISPYESGIDHSPTFDEVLGLRSPVQWWQIPLRDRWVDLRNVLRNYNSERLLKAGHFRVKDALVNALYADSLATMAALHRRHGHVEAANAYATRAGVVTASLTEKLWDRSRGAFFSLYGFLERRTAPLTVGSLMPLVVEELPADHAATLVERHLSDRSQFWLQYPVPSVSATEDSFGPRGSMLIWRGPTWVNTNWLLWRGLQRHGFHDLAEQLAHRTLTMVAESGLREFYHPHSGRGMGASSFGWSGLVLDMVQG